MGVLAYHLIWTTYGFWLPNDERGSGSSTVRAFHLRPFGPATKDRADGERSVADRSFDRALWIEAKRNLKHRPNRLTRPQATAVGAAIAEHLAHREIIASACCVLPDHIHLLVLKDNVFPAEQLLPRLKANATRLMRERGVHPHQKELAAGMKCGKVFA